MADTGIFIKIDGDSADYQKAIGNAIKTTNGFGKATEDVLKGLQDKFKQTSKVVDDFGGKTDKAGRNFKQFNGVIGQAGFQIQDLAVQLQSGTSAFVAFGQQGSQLAGAFGPGGAVVGAIIAVGAAVGGVLVNSLGSATQSTEELQERIQGLGKDLQELTRDQREFLAAEEQKKIDDTRQEFNKLAEEIGKVTQKLELADAGLVKIGGRRAAMSKQKELAKEYREELVVLQAQLDTVFQELEEGERRVGEIRSGVSEDSEEDRLKTIQDLTAALQLQADTLGLTNEERLRYIATQQGATAEELAAIDVLLEKINLYNAELEADKQRTKDKAEQARERAKIEREEEMEAARAARAREAIARQEAAAIAAAKAGLYNQLITTVTAANDLLFKDQKDAATANALVAGIESTVQAYRWGAQIGGPVGGAAAAALAATATGLQIAKIRSVNKGGSGSVTGPAASSGADIGSQAVQQQTQQNITIRAEGDVFTSAQVGNIIDEINRQIEDGAVIRQVNFQ